VNEPRNQIVHEYYRLDPDALWEFVGAELDTLEREHRPPIAKKG